MAKRPATKKPAKIQRPRLTKVISGGQTGADQAGLNAAEVVGLKRGGMMPRGFRTKVGPNPEFALRHGLEEHPSSGYPPRTYLNVSNSDGTVRFATNWKSPGEILTYRACVTTNKPIFDVHLGLTQPQEFVDWLVEKNIVILNVAGNSDETSPGIGAKVEKFLVEAFTLYRQQ